MHKIKITLKISKLRHYGVTDTGLRLLIRYLTSRKQSNIGYEPADAYRAPPPPPQKKPIELINCHLMYKRQN